MSEFKDLPYYTIKKECTKRGLNSKGTKEVLLARLDGKEEVVNAPEPEIKAELPEKKEILEATPEELSQFLPNAVGVPKVNYDEKFGAWINSKRLQELENMLSPIAVGKGKFRFDLDHEGGAFTVEFSGGASGLECTSLIDVNARIVRRATQYFTARLAVGGNGQKSRI